MPRHPSNNWRVLWFNYWGQSSPVESESLISFKVYALTITSTGIKKKLEEQKPTKIDFMIEKIRIIE